AWTAACVANLGRDDRGPTSAGAPAWSESRAPGSCGSLAPTGAETAMTPHAITLSSNDLRSLPSIRFPSEAQIPAGPERPDLVSTESGIWLSHSRSAGARPAIVTLIVRQS